jgi:hypothetical protein
MGTDIYGFVECRATYGGAVDDEDAQWHAAMDLDLLYNGRNYDAFGCLFGVRNEAGFRPLAGGRGLPAELTAEVRKQYEAWGAHMFDPSWVGWAELAEVDWDEPVEAVSDWVHEYIRSPEQERVRSGMSFHGREGRPEGAEWEENGKLFRVERMTRRDAVPQDGEWAPVWAVMRALADVHGGENVRLVVWFDS